MMKIIKENAIIKIQLDDEKEIQVNIESGEIKSYTGRKVAVLPEKARYAKVPENYKFLICYLCKKRDLPQRKRELKIIASYWENLDRMNEIPDRINPDGYIEYIKQKDLKINNRTLDDFQLQEYLKKFLNEKDLQIWMHIRHKHLYNSHPRLFSIDQIRLLVKIYRNSMNKESNQLWYYFPLLITSVERFKLPNSLLDRKRDARYNWEIVNKYLEKSHMI